MKRKLLFFGILLLLCASGCKKRTCRCVDVGGHVTTGIALTPAEKCSDLEPMMGKCTQE